MPSFPFTLGTDGRYQVERVFADSGGMGLLYHARDMRCAGNEVLIKTTRYDGGEHARHFRYTRDEAVKHIEATHHAAQHALRRPAVALHAVDAVVATHQRERGA